MNETATPDTLPVKWAKVIDHTKCIGCHACSTACKSENQVPVLVNRTYVKYVDVGMFPQVRRAFQVTRCNQCDDPPCTSICPTAAMHARPDGIVDFDKSMCIGCKACIAACPYDAIFINPEDHAAEKCNFCAHRLDIGLEPACVVVCPTEAILVGNLKRSVLSHCTRGRALSRRRSPARKRHTPKAFLSRCQSRNSRPRLLLAGLKAAFSCGVNKAVFLGKLLPVIQPAVILQLLRSSPMMCPIASRGTGGSVYIRGPRGSRLGLILSLHCSCCLDFYRQQVRSGAGVHRSLLEFSRSYWSHLNCRSRTSRTLLLPLYSPTNEELACARRSNYQPLRLHPLNAFSCRFYCTRSRVRTVLLFFGLPLSVLAAVYTAYLFAQATARDLWQNPLLPSHLFIQALLAGSAVLL